MPNQGRRGGGGGPRGLVKGDPRRSGGGKRQPPKEKGGLTEGSEGRQQGGERYGTPLQSYRRIGGGKGLCFLRHLVLYLFILHTE